MEDSTNLKALSIDKRAYYYFPTEKEQKTQPTKKGTRFYFYGHIKHDEYEKKQLEKFYDYVNKNKLQYDKNFYDQQRVLLFLQGNKYKPKQTIQAMKEHLNFRKQYLPQSYENVRKYIDQGYFYPTGRDKYFRPVLVFNAKLVDLNDVEGGIKATVFTHEQIIRTMFLPGQVENWVVIYDLGGMGVTEIPINAIKTVTGTLSTNYGGRLFKMFVVNAPTTVWFGWKAVSPFLDPITAQKINIFKTNTDKSMFDLVDPSQVQQKYGGKQANRTEYWPFKIPDGVFDEKRLISNEEYKKMYAEGKLEKNTVNPQIKSQK